MSAADGLEAFVAREAATPVAEPLRALAAAAAAGHPGTVAVLAYGSCLRGESPKETPVDLYVLTRDLAGVSANAASRLACALVPPNVTYVECDVAGERYRAKCAVLPLAVFARRMKPQVSNPYFWARFAQPSALVQAASAGDREAAIAALADAIRTAFGHARAMGLARAQGFAAVFRETYRTEFRSEGPERAQAIVDANRAYYEAAATLLRDTPPIRANWPARRFAGKFLSLLRLAKAAFTFTGGADYIAWKIERHSGERIALAPWQRRHPVLAGLLLLPKLIGKGAVR